MKKIVPVLLGAAITAVSSAAGPVHSARLGPGPYAGMTDAPAVVHAKAKAKKKAKSKKGSRREPAGLPSRKKNPQQP